MKYDVAIIGAGISGTSIAYELAQYDLKVAVIEKDNDVANGTTKANSGIIHGGYDPTPSTYMAKYNVAGNKMVRKLAKDLNVHFKNIGSLVIGIKEKDKEKIDTLYERGIKNHVTGLKIIDSKDELHKMEPNLNSEFDYALYCSSASIISPWEFALALAYTSKINGVDYYLDSPVDDINKIDDVFKISFNHQIIEADYIINCAGVFADDIYKMALKDKKDESFNITPIKGEYYLLDKNQGKLVNHIIFQTPNEKGKGVLVSPTVHGNLIVGPDALQSSKEDTSTTSSSLKYIKESALNAVNQIDFSSNIRNFSGVRATIAGYNDFFIEESKIVPHFINFAGTKSPGLTSAICFGKVCKDMLNNRIKMTLKKKFTLYPLPSFFKDLSENEKLKLLKKNKDYSEIICRCETVSKAEIINAIHAPIGARSIDAVKRRTNAGMGRCQGGFCGPKVFEILKNELHLNYDEVYQDKTGSKVVVAKTKEGK